MFQIAEIDNSSHNNSQNGGSWAGQLVKGPTLNFSSSHHLKVMVLATGWAPHSAGSPFEVLSPSPSALPAYALFLSFSKLTK